jgi:hypothetical protein
MAVAVVLSALWLTVPKWRYGKVLRELRSRFAMVNWKWQMSEHENLLNLHYNHP